MHSPFVINMRLALLLLLSIFLYSVLRKMHLNWQLNHPASTAAPRVNTVRAVTWSWLAPTGVMALFIGLSGNAGRGWENHFVARQMNPQGLQQPQVPDDSGVSLVSLESSANEPAVVVKPKWIEEGNHTSGDARFVVLSSKLWSTEAEARQELIPQVAAILREDFEERHHQFFDRASHQSLSDEVLAGFAIKQQFTEQIDQDFGTFSAPMRRLWMQVEVSPMVRTAIYPAWKSAVMGNRVLAVGSVLALLTLAANATSLFAKMKSVPNRRFTFATTIVAASVIAWVFAGIYVMKLLCS